jgi:type IV pilus assembly protein PilC
VDPRGFETRGTIDVTDQTEALRRIKEMGLFPTKILEPEGRSFGPRRKPSPQPAVFSAPVTPVTNRRVRGKVRPRVLAVFTRQLATLVEAGMPLLRGLRTLAEQETNTVMKRLVEDIGGAIENGSSLGEAVAAHPKVFNRLYVNMVKAGELGGALEITLKRLAEFLEKAERIKGKIKSALFYPCAVLGVASAILTLMMVFVIPRFQVVFTDLMSGRPMPGFTLFVLTLSQAVKNHIMGAGAVLGGVVFAAFLLLKTQWGRYIFDWLKLSLPILGPVFRKASISRFARTLGTLASSGVPILQALIIVRETAANRVIGRVIAALHENVKQGDPIAPTLKESGVFPAMVAGMVDVGEQTGALPEMLLKVADGYDEEVDNAVNAMTSLLEPLLIVLLAIVVGSIVIAMFLPLISIMINFDAGSGREGE